MNVSIGAWSKEFFSVILGLWFFFLISGFVSVNGIDDQVGGLAVFQMLL